MAGRGVLMLCAAVLACPAPAQDPNPELDVDRTRVVPPSYQVQGEPNPAYGAELEARVHTLRPSERKPFFKHLRKQQRELARRVEDMTFNYEKAKDLGRDVKGEGPGVSERASALVDYQRRTILKYKEIQRQIDLIREREDPQRVDALDFQADLYAGTQFSNLYSEGNANSGFFSTSKPFVSLDLRNTFRWPGQDRWLDFFGTLSFQADSKEQSDTVSVITTSGNFKGEMGVWYMKGFTERVSWGLLGSIGMVGYAQPASSQDLSNLNRDDFAATWTLGLTLRQEEGPLRTSFAEVAYVKDPLFLHPNRLMVRGQVVLTQFGSRGSNGDFYMEGKASKGRAGRDEALLTLGIRLSTLSFFRSLGGGS